MKKFVLLSVSSIILSAWCVKPDWGFFGHRKINYMAVLTLPYEMLKFFKSNINHISEHAVDPDMRRYATKYEAMRHYIDIDMWDTIPFSKIPRDFGECMIKFGGLNVEQVNGELVPLKFEFVNDTIVSVTLLRTKNLVQKRLIKQFIDQSLMPTFYDDQMKVSSLKLNYAANKQLVDPEQYPYIVLSDSFSQHGILPFYLEIAVNKLSYAMKSLNKNDILRHAADLGHYVGDAHVPLHTTVNYNGQLTDQLGIHAFWESRIPELFALSEYDFFVGKAEYIPDLKSYIWSVIIDTHSKMPEVLRVEKELSKTYPSDRQYAFDSRLGQSVKLQSREYSKAYENAMQGMVEEQMAKSIKSLGDLWFTAFINAGSPDFSKIKNEPSLLEKIIPDPKVVTRDHSN